MHPLTKAAEVLAELAAGGTYIAGPMTGLPDFNHPAFNAAAATLRAQGRTVINPADHGVVPGAAWEDYVRADLALLAGCETIYLLPGWSRSRGAMLEHHVARTLGMPVEFADGAETEAEGQKLHEQEGAQRFSEHHRLPAAAAATIIPAGEWPAKAVLHSWDRPVDGVEGTGYWMTYDEQMGAWIAVRSGLIMPPGYDWRVPVLRPTTEDSSTVAPVIDLEQFRRLSDSWLAQAAPRIDLAADHTGMLVDYSGLICSAQRALLDDPGIAEMLRQLCRHLEELGRRWYAGDRKVVDEFLQLYCIESEARAALVKQPTKGEGES